MHRPMRFKIGIGVVFALIILIIPTAAALRADNASKPMMSHDFTDVPVAGQEFMEPFINEFYHQGITGGCSTSPMQYCPTNPVTRGSMAVFIGRALGYVDMVNEGFNARAYFNQTGTGVADFGVISRSPNAVAVVAMSTSGIGVYGESTSGYGLQGYSSDNYGLLSQSTNSYGAVIESIDSHGLLVEGGEDVGTDDIYDIQLGGVLSEIWAFNLLISSDDDAVIDLDNNNNGGDQFAIRDGLDNIVFSVTEAGNVLATGSKSAIVDTVNHGTRALYAVEATENWFEDFGTAEVVDGEVVITIDPVYAETVNLAEEYHVFFTPIDSSADLYVTDMTATSFTVRSDDSPNVRFSYRLVAKRLGYEDVRMEEIGD